LKNDANVNVFKINNQLNNDHFNKDNIFFDNISNNPIIQHNDNSINTEERNLNNSSNLFGFKNIIPSNNNNDSDIEMLDETENKNNQNQIKNNINNNNGNIINRNIINNNNSINNYNYNHNNADNLNINEILSKKRFQIPLSQRINFRINEDDNQNISSNILDTEVKSSVSSFSKFNNSIFSQPIGINNNDSDLSSNSVHNSNFSTVKHRDNNSTAFNFYYRDLRDGNKTKELINGILNGRGNKNKQFNYVLFYEKDKNSEKNEGYFYMVIQFKTNTTIPISIFKNFNGKTNNSSTETKIWELSKKYELIEKNGELKPKGNYNGKYNNKNKMVVSKKDIKFNDNKIIRCFNYYGESFNEYLFQLINYFKLSNINYREIGYDPENQCFFGFDSDTQLVLINLDKFHKIPVEKINEICFEQYRNYKSKNSEFLNLVTNFVFLSKKIMFDKYSEEERSRFKFSIKTIDCIEIQKEKSPKQYLDLYLLIIKD